MNINRRTLGMALRNVLAGLALSLYGALPVLADDTEIFVGDLASGNANILLIIDTSGSMDTPVLTERPPFDPQTVYPGSCNTNAVYWRIDQGDPPECNGNGANNFFDAAQLVCDAAVQTIQTDGYHETRNAAQWDPGNNQWVELNADVKDQPVECETDGGVHGPDAGDTRRWPADDTQWTNVQADRFTFTRNGTDRYYSFYSGNWLNWLESPPSATPPSRMDVVKDASINLVRTVSNVNLGLMRYSANGGGGEFEAEGGMVIHPVAALNATSRGNLVGLIDGLQPAGFTPMSETLYEARQYFAGDDVFFGVDSQSSPGNAMPSVPESRTAGGDQYLSPASLSCQRNFVIYLTDGLPTRDNSADDEIETLMGGTCDGTGEGRCLDDLAGYLFNTDQRSTVSGDQTITTYTVGFGEEVQGSTLLQETARRGNGQFLEASDSVSLTRAFNNIVAQIDATGTSFVSPAAAVNSFNRTETLSDLYVSVFEPGDSFHWAGNVKKYALEAGVMVDVNGDPAVNTSGFFDNQSRSFWSDRVDGSTVTLGGAAHEIPDPASRNLFTFLGVENDLSNPVNAVHVNNLTALDPLLGLGLPSQPTATDLINWARGSDDVSDVDADPATTVRNQMGDPMHARPVLVIYGGTEANPDAVLFTPTNDGYLHAIRASDGEELWAFIPPDLLNRLPALFADAPDSVKHYGLDSDVRAFKIDENLNGIVDGADKVYIFFGMGRGGSNYYALDVTDKDSPEHLWTLGPNELPGVGQTWAPVAFTRVAISGSMPNTGNPNGLALVLAGGYDPSQDADDISPLYNTDNVGNRIYMVDAISGDLLWYGGGPGINDTGRNLALDLMNNSIPGGMRVIDLDGDGFGDRMYAGDTGGRVWRFDIIIDADTSQAGIQVPTASQLITGGVFASLGNADLAARPDASTRRFYNTPDVALIRRRGADPYLSISLGSGWRGHPLNTDIADRFYSLRDYQPFNRRTQADYDTSTPIEDGDLVDITNNVTPSVPEGTDGWRLELRLPGGFDGEKVLAESRTFNNVVFFPTYLPVSSGSCAPVGRNRVYAVNIDNGAPVFDINRDGQTTITDRYTDIAQGGIAPEVTFLFPRQLPGGPTTPPPPGGPFPPGSFGRPLLCTVGLEILNGMCANAGTPVRTYWRQTP